MNCCCISFNNLDRKARNLGLPVLAVFINPVSVERHIQTLIKSPIISEGIRKDYLGTWVDMRGEDPRPLKYEPRAINMGVLVTL